MAKDTEANAKVVELVSPMPLDQCRRRLRMGMDRPLTFLGNQSVVGRADGTKLRLRKRISYRNPFQTRLSAEMVEQDGQTHIRCRFSMHPFVVAFLAVWFGGVLLIGGGIFVACLLALTLASSQAPSGTWLGLLVPIGMLVFGVSLVRFGQYLARDERQFLIAFVRNALEANQS